MNAASAHLVVQRISPPPLNAWITRPGRRVPWVLVTIPAHQRLAQPLSSAHSLWACECVGLRFIVGSRGLHSPPSSRWTRGATPRSASGAPALPRSAHDHARSR